MSEKEEFKAKPFKWNPEIWPFVGSVAIVYIVAPFWILLSIVNIYIWLDMCEPGLTCESPNLKL